LCDDFVRDAMLPKYLHCPLVDDVGFWKDRGAWMAFEKNMLYTLVGEKDGE